MATRCSWNFRGNYVELSYTRDTPVIIQFDRIFYYKPSSDKGVPEFYETPPVGKHGKTIFYTALQILFKLFGDSDSFPALYVYQVCLQFSKMHLPMDSTIIGINETMTLINMFGKHRSPFFAQTTWLLSRRPCTCLNEFSADLLCRCGVLVGGASICDF